MLCCFLSSLDSATERLAGDAVPRAPPAPGAAWGHRRRGWLESSIALNSLGFCPSGRCWVEASSQDNAGDLCRKEWLPASSTFQKHLLKMQTEGKFRALPRPSGPASLRTTDPRAGGKDTTRPNGWS